METIKTGKTEDKIEKPGPNDCWTDWRKYYLSVPREEIESRPFEYCGYVVDINYIQKGETVKYEGGYYEKDNEENAEPFGWCTLEEILNEIEDRTS